MVPEDLHAGLGVRVEGGLEAELRDADLLEEGFDRPKEVSQAQIVVGHQPLDLVELAQVRGVHGLVPEHAVNGKVLGGLEPAGLVGELVQHLGRHGGGVRPQQVLVRLGILEHVPVPDRPGPTPLVHLLDPFVVVGRDLQGPGRFGQEEGVVRVAGGVRLRLEERVKVPEARLDPPVAGHFGEPHLQQDLPELGPDLEERVQVSRRGLFSERQEVVRLEGRRLPRPRIQQFLGEVGRLSHPLGLVVGSSLDLVRLAGHQLDELPLLERGKGLRIDDGQTQSRMIQYDRSFQIHRS
jgi:hypothetical protein